MAGNRAGDALRRAAGFSRRYLACAGAMARLLTAGVFTAAGRERLNRIHALLHPDRLALEETGLAELVPGACVVEIRRLDVVPGNVNAFEYVALALLARARRPRRVFEIGTFDGASTLVIAANAPPDCELFTLDLPASMVDGTRFAIGRGERRFAEKPESGRLIPGSPHEARITRLLGDSGVFDFSPWRGGVDLVFVDGSHERDYVRHDSLAALAMAAPGALILWHDYGGIWTGVTEALAELKRGHPAFAGLRRIRDTSFACLEVAAPPRDSASAPAGALFRP